MTTVQYVGMDVDKQKIVLARVGAGQDAKAVEQVIANTPGAVKKYFAALLGDAEVQATYEAGWLGFALTPSVKAHANLYGSIYGSRSVRQELVRLWTTFVGEAW